MNKNLWQRFKAGLFTKAQFMTGVSIFVVMCSAVLYAYDVLNIAPFTSNTVISSQTMNDNFLEINNKIKKLNQKFVVGINSNVTISYPMTAGVPFNFNTVQFDASGYSYAASLTTNGSFVIQEAGFYDIKITGQSTLPASTWWSPELRVMKFPTIVLANAYGIAPSGAAVPAISGPAINYLASGDVVFVQAYNYDAGATGAVSVLAGRTKLIFEKID